MPEPVATPAASVPRDSHTTANNIVNGISNRANGKAPAADANKPPINGSQQQPPVNPSAGDANAGKEKYVVEGKEVWLIPQERTAWIQKGMAFEPHMDQLARLVQEQQQLTRALINDPLSVLKNISKQQNIPISKLYEKVLEGDWPEEVKDIIGQKYYGNVVEPMKLNPEQLKAREDAKWRQQREDQDKQTQETTIRRENHERFLAALGHLKAQIAEAMKDSGLPDNNTPLGTEMARQVADVMRLADRQKRALTPKQAIEMVKQQRINAVQSAFYESVADKDENGEQLATQLGEKIVAKIQKYLLNKAKTGGAAPNVPHVPKGRPTVRNGERSGVISPDDMHDYLEGIKKNNKI